MTTLLLNTFAALLMIFFAAMAYYPLFLKNTDTEQPSEAYGEDIVISVVPAPMEQNAPVSIAARGRYSTRPGNDEPEHPGHRPAA